MAARRDEQEMQTERREEQRATSTILNQTTAASTTPKTRAMGGRSTRGSRNDKVETRGGGCWLIKTGKVDGRVTADERRQNRQRGKQEGALVPRTRFGEGTRG